MEDFIDIKQKNLRIYKKDILKILNFQKDDIIFLSGSLIEGSINKLSKGMGNKLSDIDVFILSNDINRINKSDLSYDKKYLKTQFKSLYEIKFDIEIYSKQVIFDLMNQLNKYNFNDNRGTFNILNIPNGFDLFNFTSFIHRFLNGISIYNEEKFDEIRCNFNEDNYLKLMKRISINKVDINYEDVVGNIENDNLEVAVSIARNILLETIKAYIFHMKTSVDRDKWILLKIKNLAKCNNECAEIYKKFKKLYFGEVLEDDKSFKNNAEKIINFSNDVINKIGEDGGI